MVNMGPQLRPKPKIEAKVFPPKMPNVLLLQSVTHIITGRPEYDDLSLRYDIVIKFWIVAENLSNEISDIFHVEIPKSLNRISCYRVKKTSREYKKYNSLLAV